MKQFTRPTGTTKTLITDERNSLDTTPSSSRCKSRAGRGFYLAVCGKEGYSSRELQRQIDAMQFERTILGNQKLSATLSIAPGIDTTFKDSYVLGFWDCRASTVKASCKPPSFRT